MSWNISPHKYAEKYMKNKQKKKIRILAVCAGAAVVILLLIFLVQGVRRLAVPQVDTTDGMDYIREAEETEISSIEAKISQLEQQPQENETARSVREMFAVSVVMGDSITAGFSAYDALSPSSVIAENSVLLSDIDAQVERAALLKPQIIFLSYGINELAETGNDAETFAEEYETFIGKLREAVPDAHIFVNSIFPVLAQALEEEPRYEEIAGYNTALEEMCGRLQVGFIDNSSIAEESYYEPDGIHFQAGFYPVWAQRMAEVAAL